jgi:hypothetical protein
VEKTGFCCCAPSFARTKPYHYWNVVGCTLTITTQGAVRVENVDSGPPSLNCRRMGLQGGGGEVFGFVIFLVFPLLCVSASIIYEDAILKGK